MKNKLPKLFLVFIICALALSLTDPFMWLMPTMTQMIVLLLLTLCVGVWSGFVLTEQGNDERELVHRMNAGRIAYLAGLAIATLALLVQGITHHIDPWIACIVAVMVSAKLLTRLYEEHYR